jgi:hypothetical protein
MQKTVANTIGRSSPMAQNPSRANSRTLSISMLSIAIVGTIAYRNWTISHLRNESFATGYVLVATCLALISLGIRKRLPLVPLGRVAIWQSAHHYLGTFCLVAYCLHAGAITTGWLESLLAVLFWTILLSGFLSWYVNKKSPKMLRTAGSAILRSDIPTVKTRVSEQAYQIALQAAGSKGSMAIADYYRSDLTSYFSKPRSLGYRLLPTGKKKRNLLAGLVRLDRYLDETGRELKSRLSALVQEKDDLDFQSAIQQRVRICAAFHTILLGAFVVFSMMHIVLAHLYSSHW